MKFIFGFIVSVSLILFVPHAEGRNMQTFTPKEGFLPDEATAIAVAEIILIKIYGADQIKGQRPFYATLNSDVWEISGSIDPNKLGGVAHIKLRKNGQVVQLTHSR